MSAAHAMSVAPPLDERALRAAFGRFATGVTFVSTTVDGTPLGLIVSSFTAVSLEPPLVSFCPARNSLTWRRMRQSGAFTIRVLGSQHARFARRAAEPGADRFADPLRDPLAVIRCDLEAEHATGDHSIVVGRVRDLEVRVDSPPLVHFAGALGAFHPQEIPCPQT
jgi:3-hydroxy-9,10-secoandrosta-1,3,5(10)-triene-9,17-dione monooxygenase reductase component